MLDGEIPVVWFSTDPFWEKTANKSLVSPDGSIRHLNMTETMSLGAWRFGLPTAELLGFSRLRKAARMSRQMSLALKGVARDVGANPRHWYGSLEPVSIYRCTLERFTDGAWAVPEEMLQ